MDLDLEAGPAAGVSRGFLDFAAGRPECQRRESFAALDRVGALVDLRLQGWPTLIDSQFAAELARASVGVSRLIKSIPRRLFDGDIGRLSRYYELHDTALTALIVEEPNGFEGALGRGDFILTAGGLRCVEFNMGSHLGGWQTPFIAGPYRDLPVLAELFSRWGGRLTVRDTIALLMRHLVEEAAALAAADGELNVVFVMPVETPNLEVFDGFARPRFAAALAAVGLEGSLLYLPYTLLTEREGALYARGRRVHAVVEIQEGETAAFVFRSFKSGGVRLYNGLSSAVLSDKRNLALLSEAETSPVWSAEERELIQQYVPWTRAVCPRYTSWRGQRVFLPDFLATNRSSLVLKPARGTAGGTDVLVGRFTPEAEWTAAVRRALVERWWIVQEEAESLPFLYQHGDVGSAPHDVIWNLFVFGRHYGGCGVRVLPKGGDGVVNAVRGATTGLVFEIGEGALPEV